MSRTATLVGYAVLAAAAVGYQIVGLLSRRIPTIGQAASVLARWRTGRLLLLAGWLWVGWHLFARSRP